MQVTFKLVLYIPNTTLSIDPLKCIINIIRSLFYDIFHCIRN